MKQKIIMTISAGQNAGAKVVLAPRHKSKCLIIFKERFQNFKLTTEFEQYLIKLNK